MSEPITRPGGHLPDKTMQQYDRFFRWHTPVDWTTKDRSISEILPALKQKAGPWTPGVFNIPQFTPISDQGPVGSCVANAWCDMMEILAGLDVEGPDAHLTGGAAQVQQLSRLFLYWTARYYTGDTEHDNGTYLRSAATQLNKVGIIEEKYFPYTDLPGSVFKSPPLDLYTMASNNRLHGFYRVDITDPTERLHTLEQTIRASHPFVFGVDVDATFEGYRGGPGTWSLPPGSPILGSHAMICVGVGYPNSQGGEPGPRYWILRNSWGKGWGHNGHIQVSDSFVRTFTDIWVGTRMRRSLQ